MRTDLLQANLRDLYNKPSNQMATPGAKSDDIVSAFAGDQAMEQAKARGEEMQSEMKGETRANTQAKTEEALASREKVFSERSETKEELHLADLAAKRSQFNQELEFGNEQMEVAKNQAGRATLMAGIGAAIKLGNTFMVQKEMKKYVAGVTGLGTKYDTIISQNADLVDRIIGKTKERKGVMDSSFLGE